MSAGRIQAWYSRIARFVWVPAFLALAACGGPTAADIKNALQTASLSLLGDRMAPVFEDVSDVDCKAAQGKPGFVCAFNATSFSKMMNARSSQIGEARFVQDNSTWVMMADK